MCFERVECVVVRNGVCKGEMCFRDFMGSFKVDIGILSLLYDYDEVHWLVPGLVLKL